MSEGGKNCLCSARSLLFYQLKMFSVVLVLYLTAYLSQGLYTFVATAISKYVAIKAHKKSHVTDMYSDIVLTLKREIKLNVVIFKTLFLSAR
jgi:hypothetical protein